MGNDRVPSADSGIDEVPVNSVVNSSCPNCGYANEISTKVCLECGYVFAPRKKKSRVIKAIVAICIVIGLVIISQLGIRQYRLYQSDRFYQDALSYEEKNEYESALSLYSAVIKEDKENFEKAQEKIVELNDRLLYIKQCAKAWVAADGVCSYFDADSIKNIYYAEDDSAYALMYGKGVVSIVSPFGSTDCTFIISSEKDAQLEANYSVFYNSQFDLYIHAIGVENFSKGWLSDLWNVVTDTYTTTAKQYCTETDIEIVQKYVDEYYKTKDISVFE